MQFDTLYEIYLVATKKISKDILSYIAPPAGEEI